MTKRTIMTLGLAALLAGTMAFAQGPGGPRKGNRPGPGARHMAVRGGAGFGGFMSPMMMKALDITDTQKEAIKAEMTASREATKPIAEKLRELRTQFHEAVKAGNDAALDSLAAQSGDLHGDLMAISLKSRSKIYNTILTAEQRAKLEELRAEGAQRFQNRRNRKAPPATAPAPPAAL